MEKRFQVIAAYKFFDIADPQSIREPLRNFCQALGMKGTILLSCEGINFNVSAESSKLDEFRKYLTSDLKFPELEFKEHFFESQPFNRMLVKVKKEIISMGMPEIKPADFTGPNLAPVEFKKWLDEKRDITVLDTRNDYEVEMGKFENAVHLNVGTFRKFAEVAKDLPSEMKEKPLVMYCTGGIRCEKASALFIQKYGFKNVYQLEGGILKYFQEVGSDHYQGDCWVFDQRVGLNADGACPKN